MTNTLINICNPPVHIVISAKSQGRQTFDRFSSFGTDRIGNTPIKPSTGTYPRVIFQYYHGQQNRLAILEKSLMGESANLTAQYHADTPMPITTNSSDFTGGKLSTALHNMLCITPSP